MKKFLHLVALVVLLSLALMPSAPTADAQLGSVDPNLFITEDGSFSVLLPTDWYASGDRAGLRIANSEAALSTDPQAGEIALLLLPDVSVGGEVGFAAGETLAEFADTMGSIFSGLITIENSAGTLGEGKDEREVIFGEGAANDGTFDVLAVSYNLTANVFGVAVIIAPPGELAGLQDEMLETLLTVRYSYLLDGVHPDETDAKFIFPSDWLLDDDGSGFYTMVNTEEGLANAISGQSIPPVEGEYRIVLVDLDMLGIPVTDEDAVSTLMAVIGEGGEGITISEPVYLPVGDLSIPYVTVNNGVLDQGYFIVVGEEGNFLLAYAGVEGQGHDMFLVGLNILLSTQGILPAVVEAE